MFRTDFNEKSKFLENGYLITAFSKASELRELVVAENWSKLDSELQKLTSPAGELFHFLLQYCDFSAIEFIISIRDAKNDYEEDGIWHDDGGRVFAFSLSLTINAQEVEGGILGIRKKSATDFISVPTPDFGRIILFLTGHHGYEHKIHAVTKGKRIVIAGWCS